MPLPQTQKIKISNNFHQASVTIVIFAGIGLKLEKAGPPLSFNPVRYLPSVALDGRKQFQCLNIGLYNKTGQLFVEFN